MSDERHETITAFDDAVTMSATELERWLASAELQSVGQKANEDAESIGHQSGRQIVAILQKRKAAYTDEDLDQMRRVVSYVHRHLAQRPDGNIEHTRWRYSLMNWGHDPLKKA